jgi:hypothetical protein
MPQDTTLRVGDRVELIDDHQVALFRLGHPGESRPRGTIVEIEEAGTTNKYDSYVKWTNFSIVFDDNPDGLNGAYAGTVRKLPERSLAPAEVAAIPQRQHEARLARIRARIPAFIGRFGPAAAALYYEIRDRLRPRNGSVRRLDLL